MRNASPALKTLLNTASEVLIADLITIIPLTGSSTYLTAAPTDVTIVSQVDNASHTFKAGGTDHAGVVRPSFSTGQTKIVVGTQVDNLDLTLMTDVLATIGGLPWTQQARLGYFDGAYVCLERAFTATWGDWSAGTIIRFWGSAGQISPTRNTLVLSVVSDLGRLQRPTPRNVFQPGCLHNVYDAGCTLLKATFTTSGAVSGVSTGSVLFTNLASLVINYYALGVITFTSGANAGLSRTVQSYASGVVNVTPPFPSAPAIGDAFTIYPGCDKLVADAGGSVTTGTCNAKFANLVHARGYPFTPVPESST